MALLFPESLLEGTLGLGNKVPGLDLAKFVLSYVQGNFEHQCDKYESKAVKLDIYNSRTHLFPKLKLP